MSTSVEMLRFVLSVVGVFAFQILDGVAADPPAANEQAPRFSEHLVLGGYTYAFGTTAADLDGDGDLDLTSSDAFGHDSLYWLENDGKGIFKKHFIQKNDPQRIERHAVGDLDSDGNLDVVVVKNLQGHLLWFRNSGSPRDGKLWEKLVITREMPLAYDVTLADIDHDGDLDAAASSWKGSAFAWFENTGRPTADGWPKHFIEAFPEVIDYIGEQRPPQTLAIRAADFDGDGDVDLLGTVHYANLIVWYENLHGDGTKTVSFRKHIIDNKTPHPTHGQPVDIDGDGDTDILMALGMHFTPGDDRTHVIAWYENTGAPADGPWPRHVVATGFGDAFEVVPGDLDGDGDVDAAATSWRAPGRVAWLQNPGRPDIPWRMHLLKDNWHSANQVLIADLNGDGRLDIAACAEKKTQELRWWRNEGP